MINIVINSVQKWLPFERILENGIVKLKNNCYIMIIRVKPINYNLKSNFEKEAILNSYKIFLKTCSFDIQIIVRSQKEDLKNHIKNMEGTSSQRKKKIEIITKQYIQSIEDLNSNSKSNSKEFFILIKQPQDNLKEERCINQLNEKYVKINEALLRCGNSTCIINTIKETKEILGSYFLSNL